MSGMDLLKSLVQTPRDKAAAYSMLLLCGFWMVGFTISVTEVAGPPLSHKMRYTFLAIGVVLILYPLRRLNRAASGEQPFIDHSRVPLMPLDDIE